MRTYRLKSFGRNEVIKIVGTHDEIEEVSTQLNDIGISYMPLASMEG